MLKVEGKLFRNRYRVSRECSPIRIKDADTCLHKCETQPCTIGAVASPVTPRKATAAWS